MCWGAVCVCVECMVLLLLRLYSSSDSDPPSDIDWGCLVVYSAVGAVEQLRVVSGAYGRRESTLAASSAPASSGYCGRRYVQVGTTNNPLVPPVARIFRTRTCPLCSTYSPRTSPLFLPPFILQCLTAMHYQLSDFGKSKAKSKQPKLPLFSRQLHIRPSSSILAEPRHGQPVQAPGAYTQPLPPRHFSTRLSIRNLSFSLRSKWLGGLARLSITIQIAYPVLGEAPSQSLTIPIRRMRSNISHLYRRSSLCCSSYSPVSLHITDSLTEGVRSAHVVQISNGKCKLPADLSAFDSPSQGMHIDRQQLTQCHDAVEQVL